MTHTKRVPHVLLLQGPEGSPNLALALALIRYMHCQQTTSDDACGQCQSCTLMDKLIHPDVHFILPLPVTKRADVPNSFLPDWRNFLHKMPYGTIHDWINTLGETNKLLQISRSAAKQVTQITGLRTFMRGPKSVLIWLPEHLHVTAANALLKLAEEPPPNTYLLLVSCAHAQILTTLRARALHVNIPKFAIADLSQALAKFHPEIPEKQRAQAALLAQGDLGRAIKLAKDDSANHLETFATWMRCCYACNWTGMVHQAADFQRRHQEEQKRLLAYAIHLVRAALVTPYGDACWLALGQAETDFVNKFHTILEIDQKEQLATYFEQMYQALLRNANAQMLFLSTSLRIADVLRSRKRSQTTS